MLAAPVTAGDPALLRQPGQVGGPQFGHRGRERRLAAAHRRVRHDQVHRLGQQHLLAQIVEVHGRLIAGRRVPLGPAGLVRLVPEDQRDVHVPGAQHPHRLGRLGLGQPEVDARVPLMQDRGGGGHDRAERRRECRQPQPSGPQPGEDGELVLRRVEPADHLDGTLGQQPARVG